MRDAIGGTFLIEILMVFVVLLVSFTAILVNIAGKFRVKNQIINYVEEYEYDGTNFDKIDGVVKTYLKSAGYIFEGSEQETNCTNSDGNWGDSGYCIEPVSGGNGNYYKVTVYSGIHLPFFNIDFVFPISGETKTYRKL